MTNKHQSQKTIPRQSADRVNHEFTRAAKILDEGMIAHVGFTVDGQPFVLPMAYARHECKLYLHGSSVSRLVKHLAAGFDVCVTVTHLDGMVLARSTFGHSMNYRSVMIFGRAKLISDTQTKDLALKHLMEFLVPGRNVDARQADEKELNATALLELEISEFSVKQRSGPPQDPAKDMEIDIWTGEVPFQQVALNAIADPLMKNPHPTPDYATDFLNNRANKLPR